MATPTFPSLEDWTAPWDGDGEFDADKARGLIYNLSMDKAQAEATITHLRGQATKIKSELEAAKAETKDVEIVKSESEALRDDAIFGRKVKAAIEKGIDPAKAEWLSGSTPEELAKSADRFLEQFGPSTTEGGQDESGNEGDQGQDDGDGGEDPLAGYFLRQQPISTAALVSGASNGTGGEAGNQKAESVQDARQFLSTSAPRH